MRSTQTTPHTSLFGNVIWSYSHNAEVVRFSMVMPRAHLELCIVDHLRSKISQCNQDIEVKSKLVEFIDYIEPSTITRPYVQKLVKQKVLLNSWPNLTNQDYPSWRAKMSNTWAGPHACTQSGRYSIPAVVVKLILSCHRIKICNK